MPRLTIRPEKSAETGPGAAVCASASQPWRRGSSWSRADSRTALLPVVILTTSKEETDVLLGYELRANSYIQKPVEFARFVEVIREIGLYWLDINTTPQLPRRVLQRQGPAPLDHDQPPHRGDRAGSLRR